MTLFRKVFQNQSTPATGDDGLDEEALRDTFMVDSDERVLPLDPFAVAEEAEREAHDEDAPDAADDYTTMEEVAEEELSGDAGDLPEETEEEEDVGGADIAAVLAKTRMMEPTLAVEPEAEASPEPNPTVDEVEETVAAADEAPEPAEEGPADVVAFAKEQMQRSGEATGAEPMPEPEPVDLSNPTPISGVPAPMAGRAGRRAGRVKTRLLGFNRAEPDATDPLGSADAATAKPQNEKFPVGWLVVVEGPGVGHSFSIFTGASMIGRGEDQVIKLDFGDNSISRHNHAAIAYDEEQNKFYLGHGGKSNIIRRNARPVLSTEELQHADLIRIGETTLRFVALCGSDFKWDMTDGSDASGL